MRRDGRFCNRLSEKTVQGEIKPDRTVRLPSPHGFRDVKGRRKQEDGEQTAEVPKIEGRLGEQTKSADKRRGCPR